MKLNASQTLVGEYYCEGVFLDTAIEELQSLKGDLG